MEEYSNTTGAGDPILVMDPAVESMLLGAPNQLLLLVALGGPIGRGCGIQWNFHRVVWKNSNTTALLLIPVL